MAHKGRLKQLGAVVFWLLVWQLGAAALNQSFLLASPLQTLAALLRLAGSWAFWHRVGFSALRILVGFAAAAGVGCLLAALSAAVQLAQALVSPLMQLMKAVPVASFIILALLWVRSSNLCTLIAFLMVLPVVYTAVLQGIKSTDAQLLEMARVFRIPWQRALGAIWLPQVWPYFVQSCTVGMGLAWKSGIAAEVIGLPSGSLGEALYQAKLYLETGELFACTVVIVAASTLCERLFLRLLAWLGRRWEVQP